MISLNGKVSIITGASSGIGKGTAILFSNLGSKLVISGRDENGLNDTISKCKPEMRQNIIKVRGDITQKDVCEQLVTEAINSFGQIDILVNNAAVLRPGDLENLNMEDFDLLVNTNLRAAIFLTKLCTPFLIQQKGSVINVSSVAGTNSLPGLLSYCVCKSGLDQFTKCVALELASKGVRVNSVNPGAIMTNIVVKTGSSNEFYEKFMENSRKNHAMGRTGHVDEVANTIAFLASDLSSFITGELIHVDGGRHIMSPYETFEK